MTGFSPPHGSFAALLAGEPQARASRTPVLALADLALLASAGACLATLLRHGQPLLFPGGLVQLDALSASMALLVSFLSRVILRFSATALDGDARRGWVLRRLAAATACGLVMALAGRLSVLAAGWIGMSLAVQPLMDYAGTAAARLAAVKKFAFARLADLCLLAALASLLAQCGTDEFAALPASPLPLTGLLLAGAALLKSAQFPAHLWLPDSVEAPTPVSAFLHAGVVNGGGFLAIRCAALLGPGALHLMQVIGGITVLLGAASVLVEPRLKTQLAWSTVAQMGFMMVECGFGLFAAAWLHLLAHALYKAHAFLAAGSVLRSPPAAVPARGWPRVLAVAVAGGFALVLSHSARLAPGLALSWGLLALGLVPLLAVRGAAGVAAGIAAACLAAGLFAGLHASAVALGGAFPAPPADAFSRGSAMALLAAAAALSLWPLAAAHAAHPAVLALTTRLRTGFGLPAFTDRLAIALLPPARLAERL